VAPFEYSVIGDLASCRVKCGIVPGRASSICAERNSGPLSERAQLADLFGTAQIHLHPRFKSGHVSQPKEGSLFMTSS
jgi:hypothetical protein